MHLVHRKTCRVCGNQALARAIDLGEQHLQGSFVKPGKELPPARRVPLSVVRCDTARDERACGLLQLEHTTPPDVLYAAYWYRSGTNQTMRSHLAGIAREVVEVAGRPGARVLDIGCNDGTLLACYPDDYVKFGVDPSDVAQSVKGATVIQDVFPSRRLAEACAGERFDAVTSIAMFYDLESPVACARAIADLLAPGGVWVVEMSYMPTMLENDSYDTICHEHLEYYSLAVLERIVRDAGLRIFRVALNAINGGSIRVFVAHLADGKHGTPEDRRVLLDRRLAEFELRLDTEDPYRAFQRRIEKHRDELAALLHKLRGEGKRVHVYGASTKGNTILQWCGIDHTLVECAADRNPDKHGARTLGTDIPIVSEEESRAKSPDYYLVLPWHFRAEFLERERPMIDRGCGMIFPLPRLEIVRR
ncbi:MAG TPA: class I SAM-dependent methyltransferase [Polyangiaceae bacterium]|nr:class I SAM-dependent methyltransferase [Polyangiaceae bacterium]